MTNAQEQHLIIPFTDPDLSPWGGEVEVRQDDNYPGRVRLMVYRRDGQWVVLSPENARLVASWLIAEADRVDAGEVDDA